MLRVVLSGLRARKLRLVATAAAIVLGVGFVAGTLIFSDTAKAGIYDGVARFGRNADVVVHGADATVLTGPALPASTIETVRAVDGVASVSARMSQEMPILDKNGKLLGSQYNPGTAVFFGDEPQLNPFDLDTGRLPSEPGEAALETNTAERGDFAVGDTVTILDSAQAEHAFTVVGIVDCGSSQAVADNSTIVLTQEDMATVAGMTGAYSILATAEEGVSAEELVDRVDAALADDVVVQDGEDFRFDLVNGSVKQFKVFLYVLLIFAGIACIVSVFVIYNTFTILIAQRMRETALLRCVGASRGQVFGSVFLESVIVGLLGSAMGFALGIGVAYFLTQFGGQLTQVSEHSLVITLAPIGVSVLVGTLATVISAIIPAFRATGVSPLAALGTVAVAPVQGVRKKAIRIGFAVAIAAGGTAMTIVGSQPDGMSMTPMALTVFGGITNFLAVLVLAPLIVGPVVRALGWLPGRLGGSPVRLAVANAHRAPGRTAATMAALMIGIGLISASSVATATVRATADRQIQTNYPVDYFLSASLDNGAIPASVADQLSADDRLEAVVSVRKEESTIAAEDGQSNGGSSTVGSIEPTGLAQLPSIELASGSLDDLQPGTAIVGTGGTIGEGREIGDTIRITTESGTTGEYTIVGLADGYIAQLEILLSWEDMAALNPLKVDDDFVLIRAASGVSPNESRSAIHSVTDDFPLVTVDSMAEVRAQITSVVDSIIAVIAGLLAFAIIIALLGIMNTLSLSVLERTRESATIRALGLTKGQLRAMIIAEALLIALGGALVGGSLGVFYGWAATRVMFGGMDIVMTIPVDKLVLYAALAAIAGTLAAVLPARKAAKASVVTAMANG